MTERKGPSESERVGGLALDWRGGVRLSGTRALEATAESRAFTELLNWRQVGNDGKRGKNAGGGNKKHFGSRQGRVL